jgi:serine/threonine protein kinase
MLKICSHPNIVKYFGFYETSENFAIIEEYCPYGDFSSFINENKQNLSILEIQYIIGQIIICLEYLSTKNIIHRDIKPENFLLTDNFNLKLIDFGTSTFIGKIFDIKTNKFIDDNCKGPKRYSDSFIFPHQFNEEQHPVTNNSGSTSFKYKLSDIFNIFTYPFSSSEEKNNSTKFEDIKRQKFVGTAEYMAPEIINSKKTGFYTDMWSVMCILYLCFTGVTPFSDKTEYLIFQNITHVKYNEDKINLIPEEARDLIKSFFKSEPRERIGYKNEKEFDFNKIKSHPFFLLKEEKENFNINITHIKQSLMFKCSYFRKLLEKKNKNYMNNLSNVQSSNKINDNISDYSNNSNNKDKTENDKEKESIMENTQNGKIIKSGLLKKKSPYFYYDLRKVILYDTPRIEYIDPDKSILKGTINLSKKCSAQLLKSNQFELVTPKRTFVFMCKDRYDISPWVSAINNAIDKFSKS